MINIPKIVYKIYAAPTINFQLHQQIISLNKIAPNLDNQEPSAETIALHNDKYYSEPDIKYYILVYCDNLLIGRTAIFTRNILIDKHPVLLGGIGKVRVAKLYRKMSIAKTMCQMAIEKLTELNCDLAFLCTDLNSFVADFYRHLGFIILPHPYTFMGKSGKTYSQSDGLIRVINTPAIVNDLLSGKNKLHLGSGNW